MNYNLFGNYASQEAFRGLGNYLPVTTHNLFGNYASQEAFSFMFPVNSASANFIIMFE
jgi:hypothetical protein